MQLKTKNKLALKGFVGNIKCFKLIIFFSEGGGGYQENYGPFLLFMIFFLNASCKSCFIFQHWKIFWYLLSHTVQSAGEKESVCVPAACHCGEVNLKYKRKITINCFLQLCVQLSKVAGNINKWPSQCCYFRWPTVQQGKQLKHLELSFPKISTDLTLFVRERGTKI